ncbi:4-hydroxyphenylacetate 3-hydroxylase N-terminal domain-containing protein [Capillimicrobium parvum]|uniref:4-nitrophenol 2-monooxygenase, oxygenase component n=1 Tax=Capillimicrobium parvum TaxID=2884022 RepID=A0A9E6Y0C8_9ACTN|nr:4-hydroxyphenylacetate 3-hydroxylase N-terminal domain-containing protein [Capillimicrobium parvum]UGS37312.1 4-nitrophenol 2-monooxygenase, oxygenase component [Capillimicrobium parvum]
MTQFDEPAASTTTQRQLPFTGDEYLESLRDGREVWIYGERVDDVTTHPAFRNSARSIARLYDAMHDPQYRDRLTAPTDTGNGGFTHPLFKVAHTRDDLRASRDAVRVWAELTFGWMGRTPDYKAALLGSLGADPDWYGGYAGNARAWYRDGQERILYLGHAIMQPPVDRHRPPDEVSDVYVHVEDETDNGLIVSGAKVVATGSPLTHHVFISHFGLPMRKKEYALIFMAPTNAPGVKFLSRASYELVAGRSASPFDYPLSSRLDENDSIIVFDRAEIPWESVLVYDIDRMNAFDAESGWESRALLQAATRMTVKLEFLAGLMSKALDIKGGGDARGIQAAFGEIIANRNIVAGLVDGGIESALPHNGGKSLVPNGEVMAAYAAIAPTLYRRVKEIVQTTVSSGLIYLNSNAVDFDTPEMRQYMDRFMRGTGGITAEERSKTMKLFWDAIGSEFGGRHELYELNYFGPPELNHLRCLWGAEEYGALAEWRELVDRCMGDYDLHGWTAPDLAGTADISAIRRG